MQSIESLVGTIFFFFFFFASCFDIYFVINKEQAKWKLIFGVKHIPQSIKSLVGIIYCFCFLFWHIFCYQQGTGKEEVNLWGETYNAKHQITCWYSLLLLFLLLIYFLISTRNWQRGSRVKVIFYYNLVNMSSLIQIKFVDCRCTSVYF